MEHKIMNQRILIVGGVAGGATAAAKARRVDEHVQIDIYERGQYVSFANCGLPYYISGKIKDRDKLLILTPDEFWQKYRVRTHVNHEVTRLDRARKLAFVKNDQNEIIEVPYDKLILSQGASPIVPPLEGMNAPHVFTLRDVPDVDKIKRFIDEKKPKTAAVIGGGFIGLEMAEAFHKRRMNVTVIEKARHILPLLDDDLAWELQESLAVPRFCIRSAIGAVSIMDDRIQLEDNSEVLAELVLVSVGVQPEVSLAREAGLEIGVTGGIKTNNKMESSDPHIYAVGDAAEITHRLTGARVRIPLAGPANRQGRIAGANAAGAHMTYGGALGTSIVRVLQQTVGMTGLSSRQAREAGYSFFTSMTRDPHHALYYSNASQIVSKIIVEEGSGRLLGAQILGNKGVDKRIDVLATAIYAGMTVNDLENLDLAYAPPFGTANDPVNTAGFVSGHILCGDLQTVSPETWQPAKGDLLLDVRDLKEIKTAPPLKGAVHIPLSELRDRLDELSKDQRIIPYCYKGQRGYLAARILIGHGFTCVVNLRGGLQQAKANGLACEE